MRKELVTKLRRCFIGLTIVMAILIFLFLKYNVHMWAKDALPSAEDPNFSPKKKSIFFHETFRSGLGVRQACAVEAAARANPTREIYVLFSKPVTGYQLITDCVAHLRQFHNVKFLRVHEAEYSKGTVVQSLLTNDVLQSTFRIQHTADILRILTLNKWGGIYLDTDMIVTRSLDDLPSNFVAKETDVQLSTGILSFAKDEIGKNVTGELIKELGKKYNPVRWALGSEIIDGVLRRLCPTVFSSEAYRSKPFSDCKGVTIFDYELFYPQEFSTLNEIFSPPSNDMVLDYPYTYHMYDYLSHYKKIHRGTVYDLIAKSYCPSIHNAYNEEFSADLVTYSPIK